MDKITVVTGTRAEYGLLRPVIQKLLARGDVDTSVAVTGAHLAEAFGMTVRDIEADGVPVAARLDILSAPAPAGRAGTAARTGLALRLFLDEFAAHRPDAVLLLGDRYEIFAAAQAAALLDVPVAHIGGGDVTRGADDEWFRHCVTKMAKLHFPSCEEHRQRVIQMGEQPARVFNVGGLGDENIRAADFLSREELAASLSLPQLAARPFALVTYHPETAGNADVAAQAAALLEAAERHGELFYVFTGANADAGGEHLNGIFKEYCDAHENAAFFVSLGAKRYLSAMKYAALVLGNSSSGVVETPSMGVPAVNIGMRQEGRPMCANVVCCAADADAISGAIAQATAPAFAAAARGVQSPYNGGDTSGQIADVLVRHVRQGVLREPKTFYTLGAE